MDALSSMNMAVSDRYVGQSKNVKILTVIHPLMVMIGPAEYQDMATHVTELTTCLTVVSRQSRS